MAGRFNAAKAARKGYAKADWDAVSDNPAITAKQAKKGKPFADALPDLMESIKRSRGRPRLEAPKQAVTLRVSPDTLARFKAAGDDWRARMADALDKAKG